MNVVINDTTHTLPQACSVEDMLDALQISKFGLAVAIQNQIIPKSEWSNRTILNGENITLIRATQGG